MSLMMWRYMQHHGAGAPDAYAVGGFEPEFVADFSGTLNSGTEYYRSGGSDTTFSSVFTHSGLVLPATMTDSDGNLKWAPHNVLDTSSSTDFTTNAGYWNSGSTSAVSTTESDPDGGSTALEVTINSGRNNIRLADVPVVNGAAYEFRVWVKQGASSTATHVRIMENNASAFSTGTSTKIALTSSWQLMTHPITGFSTSKTNIHIGALLADASLDADCYGNVQLWGWHFYRSDLGGMVNNPDRGDSYVPVTTTAAKFLPRRNHYIYNGSTYDKAGILIESAAATNLSTYSNDFTNAAWNKSGFTITNSQSSGPDGNTSLALIEITDATSVAKHCSYIGGITDNTNETISIYVKDIDQRYVGLWAYGAVNVWATAVFDLTAESVTSEQVGASGGVILDANIEDVGGGIYRISMAFSLNSTAATEQAGLIFVSGATPTLSTIGLESYSGTGGVGVYAGLGQLEVGSTPTSYIPTSGSTVTRAAETLTVAGANLPYNATAMSFQVSGKMTYADLDTGSASSTSGQFSFVDWTSDVNNFIKMQIGTASARTGEIGYKARSSGTFDIVASGITLYSPGIAVGYNLGMRMTSSALNGAADGSSFTENATLTSIASLSSQSLKIAASDTNHFYGSVKLFRMWGTDIGDSGIETAST